MKRARLAWLVSGLGVVERGAERITLDLVRHLRSSFDITLFGRACVDGQVRKLCALARDKWLVASDFERLPAFIRAVFRRLHLTPVEVEMLTFSLSALRPLWRERFDAHLLSTGVWGSRLARLFRWVKGVPFVYVGHGGYWGEVSNAQQRPDLHIFVNQAVMEKVQRSVPGLRAAFIPNGVDLDRFAPRPSSLVWELERPTYLAVGALVREKRLDLAIRAVASLPKGSLVVVGAGLEERPLKKLGEELLGPKRFLLTAAPFAAMPEYYNACDVFTLPSLAEPFGLVYLEAMACGKPVVAPKDGTREFIVGNAGILCDCTDTAAYAAALSEAARGSASRDPRREAERFDVRIVAEKYARAIQAVLNARNR